MRVGLPVKKTDRHYTHADYRDWPDDERWELIHKDAWNMSPAPSLMHQRISMCLGSWINVFLVGRSCEVLASPVDVLLPADGRQAGNNGRCALSRIWTLHYNSAQSREVMGVWHA